MNLSPIYPPGQDVILSTLSSQEILIKAAWAEGVGGNTFRFGYFVDEFLPLLTEVLQALRVVSTHDDGNAAGFERHFDFFHGEEGLAVSVVALHTNQGKSKEVPS